MDEKQIREMVRKALQRELGGNASTSKIITEADINEVAEGGYFHVAPGSILTPLARETAMMRRITLVDSDEPIPQPSPPADTSQARIVAIGADHGGFLMKEMLKSFLNDAGYSVLDMGTDSKDSVDYPDYAHPVAEAVSNSKAWRGIIIDGAGIGSAMVANKVPGVRAALCYDQATAVNSREHNDANVLTLGAGLIGESLAKQIVKIWLTIEFGGGRHARRVNKIMAVERKYRK